MANVMYAWLHNINRTYMLCVYANLSFGDYNKNECFIYHINGFIGETEHKDQ